MDEIMLSLAESEEIEKGDSLAFRFFNHSIIVTLRRVTLQRDYSTIVERIVPLEILRQSKCQSLQLAVQELITEINLIK